MSKHRVHKAILEEIDALNERIDLKMIRGQSYRHEALRHKVLLVQLRRLTRSGSASFRLLNLLFAN